MNYSIELAGETYISLMDMDNGVDIHFSLYLGDAEDPAVSESMSFGEFLDKWIEDTSIPSNPRTMRQIHKDEASAPLLKMIEIINEKLKLIEDTPLWGGSDEQAL
jgi:hypothetical protein